MNNPTDYSASSLELLKGLDPVKVHPNLFTRTDSPDHLGQEVIDNSADEGIEGHASSITATLYADNSLEITDDGRGMPVDMHPEEHIPGVELILTRLHAGGKFSHKNYKFSGGLHGVGVSVVNALSSRLEVTVRRNGKIYAMAFADGYKLNELHEIGTTRKQDTGTTVRFWPDKKYFTHSGFNVDYLKQLLRAKAVLCSGLKVSFRVEATGEQHCWHYTQGLSHYLTDYLANLTYLPTAPFTGQFSGDTETAEWAVVWLPEDGEVIRESYVNLVPTQQGGTHVNGLRLGLLEALREFCELRSLLPRGVKLVPDDIWEQCNFVLSIKLRDPQFSSQTKDRLVSRQCASFVSGVVRDSLSLWLAGHVDIATAIAELAIANAQKRLKTAKTVTIRRATSGPALPGKLKDCVSPVAHQRELFLVEGDSAGGSAKQARDREFQAIMPLRGKILNTWEVSSNEILNSKEIHDIALAIGVDPASNNLDGLRYHKICILADADSDGSHIATLICALFLKHFRPLVAAGHIFVAMPPLYRIDVGKEVFYALDDAEKQGILDRISAEHKKGKIHILRFKGLGEMNPTQLRETTLAPETRRLLQLTLDQPEALTTDVIDQVSATADEVLDLLLAKKRSTDRKKWLEDKGNLAVIG